MIGLFNDEDVLIPEVFGVLQVFSFEIFWIGQWWRIGSGKNGQRFVAFFGFIAKQMQLPAWVHLRLFKITFKFLLAKNSKSIWFYKECRR